MHRLAPAASVTRYDTLRSLYSTRAHLEDAAGTAILPRLPRGMNAAAVVILSLSCLLTLTTILGEMRCERETDRRRPTWLLFIPRDQRGERPIPTPTYCKPYR